MACDIKLNRDQTYNSTGGKFQESDKWLLNRGQWLVLQFGYSRSWKLNEWRLSKTLINESVFQWDWASVKKASSTAAILSSSMKPLIQNDMGSSRLISSTSVLILGKNVKKKMHVECALNTIVLKSQKDLFMNKQTWCTKSAIWQEHMVKRKDILCMSLVLHSYH